MSDDLPATEKKRLNVLWQYQVLDTVPEALFDDLTELAARICEAPIAMISLVDENRQWFKSRVGIATNQTSRDVSFCAYAIKQPDVFVVPDASKDPRFANNPMVVWDPKIRFYAGAPLITPDGHALGTLCIIDKIARELRPDQKRALIILARHVVSQLELRRRSRELADVRAQRDGLQRKLDRLQARPKKASGPRAVNSKPRRAKRVWTKARKGRR